MESSEEEGRPTTTIWTSRSSEDVGAQFRPPASPTDAPPDANSSSTSLPCWFSRWLIPVAALCMHLSIGQAYAFSVFNKPLSQLKGITKSLPHEDFTITEVTWIFSIAIVILGLTSAFCGKWLERVGPRVAMLVAAIFFPAGFYLSALAAAYHQLWLLYIGYGFVGGIGLGIGYISPVSTLIKWFPDHPGLATGMAIMGFGGGALIGSPLAVHLMSAFATKTQTGVWQTFLVMGSIYLVMMLTGALIIREPPKSRPKENGFGVGGGIQNGYDEGHQKPKSPLGGVYVEDAMKTHQFYLLWGVLLFNVTAGIGILSQASNMIQDLYPYVTTDQAANFVVLLSGLNMAGRFFWSTISDYVGRKNVYTFYFIIGAVLFGCTTQVKNSIAAFKFVCCIILSMYGGGFATLPAYIQDLYGRVHVSAIHGRLLTAWSAAGLAGPNLMTYIRQAQQNKGVSVSNSYSVVMYVMCGLLGLGMICNFLIFPIKNKSKIWKQPPLEMQNGNGDNNNNNNSSPPLDEYGAPLETTDFTGVHPET